MVRGDELDGTQDTPLPSEDTEDRDVKWSGRVVHIISFYPPPTRHIFDKNRPAVKSLLFSSPDDAREFAYKLSLHLPLLPQPSVRRVSEQEKEPPLTRHSSASLDERRPSLDKMVSSLRRMTSTKLPGAEHVDDDPWAALKCVGVPFVTGAVADEEDWLLVDEVTTSEGQAPSQPAADDEGEGEEEGTAGEEEITVSHMLGGQFSASCYAAVKGVDVAVVSYERRTVSGLFGATKVTTYYKLVVASRRSHWETWRCLSDVQQLAKALESAASSLNMAPPSTAPLLREQDETSDEAMMVALDAFLQAAVFLPSLGHRADVALGVFLGGFLAVQLSK